MNINSSIADKSLNSHFSLGVGKVIHDSSSFTHSVGLRVMYFKRPYSMDGGSRAGIGAVFQVSHLTSSSFHISYQLKRTLYKRLAIFVGLEAGLLKNTEEFDYWAIDDLTRDVVFTNKWKDNYSLNMSYSVDLGLEYFIIKNESYFISTSLALQRLSSLGGLEHSNREGEFNRYEFDSIVEESPYLDEFPTNYFWLAGVSFGFNIW